MQLTCVNMGSWEILHIKPHRRTRLRWIVSRQWRMWICQRHSTYPHPILYGYVKGIRQGRS
jgi:hypothetical protein